LTTTIPDVEILAVRLFTVFLTYSQADINVYSSTGPVEH